jgi:hypothetical protein
LGRWICFWDWYTLDERPGFAYLIYLSHILLWTSDLFQDLHARVNTRVYALILVHTCPFDCSVDYLAEIRAGGRCRWPELRSSDQMNLEASSHRQELLCHIWSKIDTVLHRVQEYHFPVQSQFGTDWVSNRKFNSINQWFLQLTFCSWSPIPLDHVSEFNSFWDWCIWPGQTRCCSTWYQSRSLRDYTLNILHLHHLFTPWTNY